MREFFLVSKVVLTCHLLLVAPVVALAATQPSVSVRVGVLAKRGPERCLEKWGPTAEHLTAEISGYSFAIKPLGHDEVGLAVKRGEVDFILTNPSSYVELERLYGASRIVTLKNLYRGRPYTIYAAAIFRRADRDDIQELDDLKGRAFMAVDEESFGGWQMAWRELKKHGIDPRRDFSDLRFGGTHDAVVMAVQEGEADAGTVRADTFERMAMEGKVRLEGFHLVHEQRGANDDLPCEHSTEIYPEWPLAKAVHTSDELAEKVAVALEGIPQNSSVARAARCAGWTIPHNYESVHECLRELRIKPYQDYGRLTGGAVVRRYWPWLAAAVGLLVIAGVVSFHMTRLNRKLRQALSQYCNELTERKRTEESLRKSEQLRAESEKLAAVGRLAAGVAHEINNPLTGVLTFSHLVREKEDLDEQAKEDLDMIIHETTRVSEIVQGLLEFARERPAVKEPLDVNDVVRLTIQLLGNQEAFHDVIVKGELEERLPRVDADMNQIQQVLVNLSLNACEAMHDGGTLTISTSVQNGKVSVAVADTGCGIAREHLDQIFEPFFTTKPVGKGTGLGLSVSYGIMRQHGGTLRVQSEVGKGTVFTMVLPSMEH